jgi:gas vesicle protein
MKTKHEDYEDYDQESSSEGGFGLGFIIGAAAGAAAAILLAPRSGKETRDKLVAAADEQKENLKNKWEQTKEVAIDTVNSAKDSLYLKSIEAEDKVTAYADQAKEKVDNLTDGVKSTIQDFQKRY